MTKKYLLLMILLAVPFVLLAQEDIPEIYRDVFSNELVQAIAVVMSGTKLARNMLGDVKGAKALLMTFGVSVAYGLFRYGFTEGLWWYGVLAGTLAASSFFFTKNIGKVFSGEENFTSWVEKIKFLFVRNAGR